MTEEPVVHVIDDDDAVRDSIAFLLSAAGMPVRTYESASAFLGLESAPPPGCIVTDIRMPGMNGLDLIRELISRGTAFPVIVITGHGDVPQAVEAMKLGAADFIEKPFDDDTLLGAIRAARDGQRERDARDGQVDEIRQRVSSLSERERQVLDRLVAGQANKVIAGDLGISPRTVEVYRANVMSKMRAGSLSELVRMAFQIGLPEEPV